MSVVGRFRSAMAQVTSSVLMIRPLAFGFDSETAADNLFQHQEKSLDASTAAAKARTEFDNFVSCLRDKAVSVKVVEDTTGEPDACFPNNWFSCHAQERKVVAYPMMAKSRRKERRWDILEEIAQSNKWETLDLSHYEKENKFLEGTGSMVFDRVNKIAYASVSKRTHLDVLDVFCSKLGYRSVVFHATSLSDGKPYPLYHTNVVLSVGSALATVCLDAIRDPKEKEAVVQSLQSTGKEILPITEEQMEKYAGNVLEVCNQEGQSIVVMSSRAHSSLNPDQLQKLQQHSAILHIPLSTIETLSGGSARCMIAELHDK